MKSYCVHKYEDGICGIFEDQHTLLKTARSLHIFQPDGICKEPPPVISDDHNCVLDKDHAKTTDFHINRYGRRWGDTNRV